MRTGRLSHFRTVGLAISALAVASPALLRLKPACCIAVAEAGSDKCDWFEPANKELRIPLFREGIFNNIILVCVEVSGRAGKMILDTGSSTTFVSPELSGIRLLNPGRSVTPLKGSGWVSTGQWGEANIHLGGRYWVNRRIVVDDMGTISKSLGQRVDGILGEDLLRQYRSVVIDYENNVLTLLDR